MQNRFLIESVIPGPALPPKEHSHLVTILVLLMVLAVGVGLWIPFHKSRPDEAVAPDVSASTYKPVSVIPQPQITSQIKAQLTNPSTAKPSQVSAMRKQMSKSKAATPAQIQAMRDALSSN